jgi:hypothetical protein
MKLFKISQDQNLYYETFDSAIVAAPDDSIARMMSPRDGSIIKNWNGDIQRFWCDSPIYVIVECIGEANDGTQQGVILASFNEA